jgi:hypothetical protein
VFHVRSVTAYQWLAHSWCQLFDPTKRIDTFRYRGPNEWRSHAGERGSGKRLFIIDNVS